MERKIIFIPTSRERERGSDCAADLKDDRCYCRDHLGVGKQLCFKKKTLEGDGACFAG